MINMISNLRYMFYNDQLCLSRLRIYIVETFTRLLSKYILKVCARTAAKFITIVGSVQINITASTAHIIKA
jgi:hypothetical protein